MKVTFKKVESNWVSKCGVYQIDKNESGYVLFVNGCEKSTWTKLNLAKARANEYAQALELGTPENIRLVYEALKYRQIHPEGEFDKAGRWYPDYDENVGLSGVRSPSRSWPYSYLTACRTLKHVKLIAKHSPLLFASQLKKITE